jgi:carbon starvation protein
MYLILPFIMGFLLRTPSSVEMGDDIFLPLVGVAIWAGKYIPVTILGLVICHRKKSGT